MLKFVNLTSAMDFITVQVGSEEKQISGLTRKTTCIDVLQALIKERQTAMAESGSNNGCNEVVQTTKDQDTTAEPSFPLDKSPREIAHGYVIVETWRGNENTLSPRTQILKTWHAWGNEQKYVKFALRQSNRRIRYRDTSHKHNGEHHHHHGGKRDYRHKLSHGQRRRIRRSMMRYQQAVLMQRANMMEGKETTADSKSADDKNSQSQNTEIMFSLSEEQFVDGVLTGPDCLLYNAKFARSALGDSDLASEHCAYRRSRIHHRRRSSVIQEADAKELTTTTTTETTTYTRRSSVQHTPRKHRRRSTSRGRVTKQRDLLRHHQRMLTTGEVSAATTDSNDGDADDEKSIMAASSNVPDTSGGQRFLRQQIANTSVHQLPSNDESYMSGATSTSTTTTGTDSSCGTTTCSETSAGSSLSGTSSSETSSSSTDYFNTEQFLAKRAAEAAAEAAAKAAANEKAAKQSGAVKLFKKVASQSLLSSFRKKKRAPAHISNSVSTSVSSHRQKSSPAVKCKLHDGGDKSTTTTTIEASKRNNIQQQNLDVISTTKREQPNRSGDIVKNNSSQQLKPLLPVLESEQGDDEVKCKKHEEENNNGDTSPLLEHTDESEEGDGGGTIEEWRAIVSSRAQLLCERMRSERKVDLEIERTTAEINKCKAQQQQHQAAQDTEQDHTATDDEDATWIRTCDDKNTLSTYIEWCQKIIDKQMQIEECKRRHEILLQEMEDERWTDGNHKTTLDTDDSKAIRFSDETYDFKTCESSEDDDEEDEEERLEQLQVSSCQQHDLQEAASSKLKTVDEEEEELSSDDDKDIDQMLSKMESSWYLHLRLTTEIDNLEYRNLEKQRLIESKRDRVVQLVREMASSSEGISPELWKEYGGMLMAYDTQLSLQHHYFDACRSSLASDVMSPLPTTCNDNLQLELTHPPSTAAPSMNQALSPWMWCEQCKLELQEQQRLGHEGTIIPKHSYTHDQLPPSLSQLPLPAPLEISPSKPGRSQLLPMYPVPICNDSDYEDLDIATSLTSTNHQSNCTESSANSTDESTTPPALSSLHRPNVTPSNNEIRNYQKYLVEEPIQSSNASTDDSGNASAGSISSFTSADGCGGDTASRSGSCDGESPPPSSGNGQDSTNPFCREEHRRSSWKSRFPFSSHQKNTNVVGMPSKLKLSRPKTPLHLHKKFNQQQHQLQSGNIYSPINDKQLASDKSCAPHLNGNKQQQQQQLMQSAMRVSNKSYYNNELAKKGHHRGFLTTMTASANEMVRMPTAAPLRTLNHNSVRAAAGMGVNLISGGKYYTKGPYYTPQPFNDPVLPLQFPIHDRRMVKMQLNDRRPVISDNDSDTGLSSLHSTDSADLFMYSETLV